MMSQKSLKNNVNKNDFKRSLLGSILFPAIALIVLFVFFTFPVIGYVTSEEYIMATEHNQYTMFMSPLSETQYLFNFFPMGMVMCGILTAVKSFYFVLSKKQVNVFLSQGISRKTMFINRTISALITLFVAVFVPMLIIYIINIAEFGASAHLTKLFLYIVSLFFVSGASGYAIGSAVMMISGNIFEAALTTVSLTFIPFAAVQCFFSFCGSFLRGYTNVYDRNWTQILTPWGFGANLGNDFHTTEYGGKDRVTTSELFELLTRDTTPDKFKVPEILKVDMGFVLPVIIWAVISVVLLVVGICLFKKRKAEHANSFGHFPISRGINTALAVILVALVGVESFILHVNPVIYFAVFAGCAFLAYFLIQLIMTRKLKATLKSLKWCGVLVGVVGVALLVVTTGFFGAYNKTPAKEELKTASVDLMLLSPFNHSIDYYNYYYEGIDPNFVEASTDEGKEAIIKAFDLVKNEKLEYGKLAYNTITFAFIDKDGEYKFRNFVINSPDTYYEFAKLVYGSEFFDDVLNEYLVKSPEKIEAPDDLSSDKEDEYYMYEVDYGRTGHLKYASYWWIDSSMLVEINEEYRPTSEMLPEREELCKALYNDLSKMTFEQLFRNNSKPVGILVTGGYEVWESDRDVEPLGEFGETLSYVGDDYVVEELEFPRIGLANEYIPVYPEMTETIAFLKAKGYELTTVKATVKELLYTDSNLSLIEAKSIYAQKNADKYSGWGSVENYFPQNINRFDVFEVTDVNNGAVDLMGYFITEKVNSVQMFKDVYKDVEHPLESVTDTAKAEEILAKAVPRYLTHKDNGRYVYVIYEEGYVMGYYLPEANLDVLK